MALTDAAARLLRFLAKGRRFAQREPEMPMVQREMRPDAFSTLFPNPYYEGAPNDISFEDIQRLSRAADQGFTLPAWRAVKHYPLEGEIDPSFRSQGAHVDLSPSGYASRIYAQKWGQPYTIPYGRIPAEDPVGAFERSQDLNNIRLMTQAAIRPARHTLLVTDSEVNNPYHIAQAMGLDPQKYYSELMGGKDPFDEMKWKKILNEMSNWDMAMLYPNVGEVVQAKRFQPTSRASRTTRAEDWLDNPRQADFEEFVTNPNRWKMFAYSNEMEKPPLDLRLGLGREMMEDPLKMRMIGNPSYVVPNPENLRDLGMGQFLNPTGRTIYDAKGGYVNLKGGLSCL